jgi:hypothetical protein
MGKERASTNDFTKARSQARAIAAAINHEGTPHPIFARAIQNVVVATSLLDTPLVPSTDGVGKVYRQLKDILGIAAMQRTESSLQQWAKVCVSSLGYSKASQQRTTTENPAVGTTTSPVRAPSRLRSGHLSGRPEPLSRRQAHKGGGGRGGIHSVRNLCHGGRSDRE